MTAPHVYARRLLKLAAFLEKLPRKRFDYETWVGDDWGGKPDLSCGTTACALGWATTMPLFRRLGLRLAIEGGLVAEVLGPGTKDSLDTAEKTFGLTHDEALFVFSPGWWLDDVAGLSPRFDATPKQVARHIRRFVERKWGLS